jgi:hypothetical protein
MTQNADINLVGTPSFIARSGNKLVLGTEGDQDIEFVRNNAVVFRVTSAGIIAQFDLANDVFLQARNAAGTADLDLLKADTSNRTVLNAASGQPIRFTNGLSASIYSDINVVATGINQVWTNGTQILAAYADSSSVGILLGALSAHNVNFSTNGVSRVVLDHANSSLRPNTVGSWALGTAAVPFTTVLAGTGTINTSLSASAGESAGVVGTTTNHVFNLRTNNTTRLTLAADGSALRFTPTTFEIGADTSDGSDTKRIFISGGGGSADSRGGNLSVYGNEYGTVGLNGSVRVSLGDVASSEFRVYLPNNNSSHGSYASRNSAEYRIFTNEVLLSGLSGATATATGIIPAGAQLLGVTVRVTTAITGATSFSIGDGSGVDLWGASIAVALNTITTSANYTANPTGTWSAAARNVVLTANGGSFTGGAVRVVAHYATLSGPES